MENTNYQIGMVLDTAPSTEIRQMLLRQGMGYCAGYHKIFSASDFCKSTKSAIGLQSYSREYRKKYDALRGSHRKHTQKHNEPDVEAIALTPDSTLTDPETKITLTLKEWESLGKVKVCSHCHQKLPVWMFNKDKSTKDGYYCQCKSCKNTARVRTYQEHKAEKVIPIQMELPLFPTDYIEEFFDLAQRFIDEAKAKYQERKKNIINH